MKAQTMRRIRQLHLYLGLFFAPMLLLFAVSGAFQVYRINDERVYGGTPPAWLAWIAAIHKNQAAPREKAARPAEPQAGKASGNDLAGDRDHAKPRDPDRLPAAAAAGAAKPGQLLKIFAVLLAVALAASTVLGIIIALNSRVTRRTGIAMLVAGTIIPIVLLKV